eukprot:scaffold42261_cov17-Tisochrysis_lutea.AAC.2
MRAHDIPFPGTAGILAVAASKPTVVATEDGMIGVKKVMTVNLTCDHRLVYGAQASEFLQKRMTLSLGKKSAAQVFKGAPQSPLQVFFRKSSQRAYFSKRDACSELELTGMR